MDVQVDTGGEDAWFISQMGGGAIGVSDGVGGWRESGVNPGGELPRPPAPLPELVPLNSSTSPPPCAKHP